MPVFLNLTDANVTDPSFWAGLDIGPDSTINASGLSDSFQIELTGNSITFTDTATGTVTSYTDADIASGSFSEFVQFIGNNADNVVGGSVGLNAQGYIGGSGDDTFTDDGDLGGQIIGGSGNDILTGGTGDNFNISGDDGDDIVSGGSGNNILSGGAGDDTLFADDGSGNLDGGADNDTIYAGLNTTFVEGGPGFDTLFLPVGSTDAPFSPTGGNVTLPNGDMFTYANIESVVIPCFTHGTRIETPSGPIPVEDLSIGNWVTTLDHDAQQIRWIGSRTVDGRNQNAPICFSSNSIGNSRKLRLSPQHRVLVRGWECQLHFNALETLCAAKFLCRGDQIYREPCEEVTYFHFMFDQHEIVFAEGASVESFYVGDCYSEVERASRQEILDFFPELGRLPDVSHVPARPFLKAFEAKALRSFP